MVTIRLARTGAKKRPFYHIIVTDSRSARDGRFIERLGYYNPVPAADGTDEVLHIDDARFDYWVSKGAQASDRVAHLYKKHRKQAPAA